MPFNETLLGVLLDLALHALARRFFTARVPSEGQGSGRG